MATFISKPFGSLSAAKKHLSKMGMDFFYAGNKKQGEKSSGQKSVSSWTISDNNEIVGTSTYFVASTLEAMFNLTADAVL